MGSGSSVRKRSRRYVGLGTRCCCDGLPCFTELVSSCFGVDLDSLVRFQCCRFKPELYGTDSVTGIAYRDLFGMSSEELRKWALYLRGGLDG